MPALSPGEGDAPRAGQAVDQSRELRVGRHRECHAAAPHITGGWSSLIFRVGASPPTATAYPRLCALFSRKKSGPHLPRAVLEFSIET